MNGLGDKNFSSIIDMFKDSYNYLNLCFGGIVGVFVRHLYIKKVNIMQRLLEYLAGAIFSIYGAALVSQILSYVLIDHNLLDKTTNSTQDILSLSAFLCGMFGLTLCEYIFNYFNKLMGKA